MTLEQLWAGWRSDYITAATATPEGDDSVGAADGMCVMCRLVAATDQEAAGVVWRSPAVTVALNAYPYTSGHVMVIPTDHVGDLGDLGEDAFSALWAGVRDAVAAVRAAYRPDGVNVGANIGRSAGAGVPGHLHIHALPRWAGDTNFATTVAGLRVLPEALPVSWRKLRDAWPNPR